MVTSVGIEASVGIARPTIILWHAEMVAGPVRVVGSPIDMSEAPVSVRLKPPKLGQHNDEILGAEPQPLKAQAS